MQVLHSHSTVLKQIDVVVSEVRKERLLLGEFHLPDLPELESLPQASRADLVPAPAFEQPNVNVSQIPDLEELPQVDSNAFSAEHSAQPLSPPQSQANSPGLIELSDGMFIDPSELPVFDGLDEDLDLPPPPLPPQAQSFGEGMVDLSELPEFDDLDDEIELESSASDFGNDVNDLPPPPPPQSQLDNHDMELFSRGAGG